MKIDIYENACEVERYSGELHPHPHPEKSRNEFHHSVL
jgi:hypothetical protein